MSNHDWAAKTTNTIYILKCGRPTLIRQPQQKTIGGRERGREGQAGHRLVIRQAVIFYVRLGLVWGKQSDKGERHRNKEIERQSRQ